MGEGAGQLNKRGRWGGVGQSNLIRRGGGSNLIRGGGRGSEQLNKRGGGGAGAT